jgi:predicted nucleotidyltransferase
LISEETIHQAVGRVVAAARPSRIILFGSYARGDPDEGSDLDFLVIERQLVDRQEEMIRLRDAIGPIGAGVDVLVCSEAEAERRGKVPGTAVYWALKEGRILYDATA